MQDSPQEAWRHVSCPAEAWAASAALAMFALCCSCHEVARAAPRQAASKASVQSPAMPVAGPERQLVLTVQQRGQPVESGVVWVRSANPAMEAFEDLHALMVAFGDPLGQRTPADGIFRPKALDRDGRVVLVGLAAGRSRLRFRIGPHQAWHDATITLEPWTGKLERLIKLPSCCLDLEVEASALRRARACAVLRSRRRSEIRVPLNGRAKLQIEKLAPGLYSVVLEDVGVELHEAKIIALSSKKREALKLRETKPVALVVPSPKFAADRPRRRRPMDTTRPQTPPRPRCLRSTHGWRDSSSARPLDHQSSRSAGASALRCAATHRSGSRGCRRRPASLIQSHASKYYLKCIRASNCTRSGSSWPPPESENRDKGHERCGPRRRSVGVCIDVGQDCVGEV